jgi:hypothetical protein
VRLVRAEAQVRLGRRDEAAWVVAAVLEQQPDHPAAWCLAGLCGDEGLARSALARLLRVAPALITKQTGATLEDAPEPGRTRELLGGALKLMAGNRSARPTTFLRDPVGELQRVPAAADPVVANRVIEDQLRRAVRGLGRAIGVDGGAVAERVRLPVEPGWTTAEAAAAERRLAAVRPRTRPSSRRSHRAELLDDAQLDQFVARGYLRVRGCFSATEAERWIAAANHRIATQPERYVKGYAERGPGRSLEGYDPARPETWTWPRLDLAGEHSFEIGRWSPRAWAAICDLLGGPERVATRTWNDAAIPNFRLPHPDTPHEVKPDSPTWHIDNPGTAMTLDGIRNGLVCVVVLSRIGPRMGGTVVAPGSVPLVARELADRPEGADFVAADVGARLAARCREFVELCGEPGDVFMLHPLLLHSPAPNPSSKVRWMSNPLVWLREPLQVQPRDPGTRSPVERAIAEGLDATT